MRLLRGEIRKLARRPASYITLVILVGIIVLLYVAIGASYKMVGQTGQPDAAASQAAIAETLRFPQAWNALVGLVVGLGGLLGVAYGAAAAGGDWNWNMVKIAVARGESRSRYVLAKLGAVLILLIPGLVVAFVVGLLATILAATLAGIGVGGLTDSAGLGRLPSLFARGWWGMAEQAAIGFAIATLARSQLAGLAAGIALYFVEQIALLLLPDVIKYLPFSAVSSLLRESSSGGVSVGGNVAGRFSIDQPTALILVTAYLVIAALVSAVFVERAEITG
jgi:hypothetical protein